MKRLSNKLALGLPNEPVVFCPGCRSLHVLHVSKPNRQGAQWTWNQDPIKPTFTPSLVVSIKMGTGEKRRCHSFIRDGVFEFLADSTHQFAGKKVPLPDLPKWVGDMCED